MGSTSTSGTKARTPAVAAEARPAAAPLDLLLLRELYGPRKPLLAGNLGGAALLAAVMWDTAPRADLIFWAILICGVTLMRVALVKRFNATAPGAKEVPFWTWAYAAGAFAGGVLWGASAGLFQAPDGAVNVQAYVLVIAGLSAAGLSGYAVSPLVFVAFLVPATLPFGLLVAVGDNGLLKPISAALYFGWLAAMVGDYSGWHWVNRDPARGIKPTASERLGEIVAPTLALVGERDLPDFHAMVAVLREQMPQARVETIPGVGHMANMEAPGAVNAAIFAFLADVL